MPRGGVFLASVSLCHREGVFSCPVIARGISACRCGSALSSVILGLDPGIQLLFDFYLCFYLFCVNFLGKADFTFKHFFRQGAGGGLLAEAAKGPPPAPRHPLPSPVSTPPPGTAKSAKNYSHGNRRQVLSAEAHNKSSPRRRGSSRLLVFTLPRPLDSPVRPGNDEKIELDSPVDPRLRGEGNDGKK